MSIEMPKLGAIQERYKILAKLGSGGMADVFLAIQHGAENFKRLVVVKRINNPQLQRGNGIKMFLSEARTVANLNHPHIVKVFDFCQMGPDICIVMEYVDGENLDYLRRAVKKFEITIPLAIVCKLMIEACNALQHAHSAKTTEGRALELIHRDIGPHNLMLDCSGYLKVIDFGIAKSATANDLTSPGMIKGKFSYLAPDLFKHKDIDGRVDLYALGLVFYELVTLRQPFGFQADATIAEVMQRVLNDVVPHVSTVVPGLPKELDPILAKAIEKDRDRRYPSCSVLAADIQEFAEKICGIASAQDVEEWLRKHFKQRIARRREFERRALKKASQSEPENVGEGETSLAGDKTENISDVIPQPSSGMVYSVNGSTLMPAKRVNPYIFLILLFVLLSGGTILVHQLFFKDGTHKSVLDEKVNQNGISDNLFIKTEPPKAEILINGNVVGNTGHAGLSLRVEPGVEHSLTIRQEGYDEYMLAVVGESYGLRRIDAKLSPKAKPTEPEELTNIASTSTRKSSRKHRSKRKLRRRKKSKVASKAKQVDQHAAEKKELNSQQASNTEENQTTATAEKKPPAEEAKTDEPAPTAKGVKLASLGKPYEQPKDKIAAEAVKKENVAPPVEENPTPDKADTKVAKLIEPARPLYQMAKDMLKRRIKGEEPAYPRSALKRRKQGEIMVKLTINPDGSIKEHSFIKDDREFHSAVLKKIEDWRFKPHYVKGRPITTYSVFKFVFRLK
jgi:TonB family protein